MDGHQGRPGTPPGGGGPAGRQRTSAEALRATVRQLDDLSHHLERICGDRNWSAQQWMIASTPFRMQIPQARRRLGELAGIDVIAQERDIGRALELTRARLLVERQLNDLALRLRVLHQLDCDPVRRYRDAETFSFYRSRILKSIKRLCYLIGQRLLEVQQGGNGHMNKCRLRVAQGQCNRMKCVP
jgi:hypothetical protein